MVAVNLQNHQDGHVPAADPQGATVVLVLVANTADPGQAAHDPEATEAAPARTTVVPDHVPVLTIRGVAPVQEATQATDADTGGVVLEEDTMTGERIINLVSKIQGIIQEVEVVVTITVIRDIMIVIFVVVAVDRIIIMGEVAVDHGVGSKGVVIEILGIVGMIGVVLATAAGRTVAAGRENQKIP